jgi:hypothetical protein
MFLTIRVIGDLLVSNVGRHGGSTFYNTVSSRAELDSHLVPICFQNIF